MLPLSRFFLPPLRFAGSVLPVDVLIHLTGQNLILPAYHAISNADVPHIKHLYPVRNEKKFRNDLDFFLKHYTALDFNSLRERIKNSSKPAKPAFFISFDDGLRQVYDVIFPILKEKGVPAAVFINTSFLDNKEMFFRYKVSLILERLKNKKASTGETEELKKLFSKYNFSIVDFFSVTYRGKELLEEAAALLNIDFTGYLQKQKPYLTTGQVRALSKEGFIVGSHSMDHPEYRFLPLKEQIRQTKESMDFIMQEFKPEYKIFAFPFTDYGVPKSFFDWMENESGIELSFGCAGLKKEVLGFHQHRIPIEKGLLPAKNIVTAEYLYYLLKKPFGKNISKRN